MAGMEREEKLAASVAKLVEGSGMLDSGGPVPNVARFPASGEKKLAFTLVEEAIEESLKGPSNTRDDARTWLRDGLRLMSARCCMEAIGFDYDAVMERLEKKWKGDE